MWKPKYDFIRNRKHKDLSVAENHHLIRHFTTQILTWQNIRNLRILYCMKAIFIELPPFERHRQDYLTDENFRDQQNALMKNPETGDVIEGTGGLRKIRHADQKWGKGKRGGLRVIYYWWLSGKQFWLYTVYNKDEMDDLTVAQRKIFKDLLKQELDARRIKWNAICLTN